jgi:Flp pilus assembly protein TadD
MAEGAPMFSLEAYLMKASLFVVLTLALGACSTEPASVPLQAAADQSANAVMSITSKSPEAIEQMKEGEQLLDNLRSEEAAAKFTEALRLDPDFTLARALLGQATPGPAGLKEMETAAGAASSLPDAERTLIAGMLAVRQGEPGQAIAAYRKVTELAPADWRGHRFLGQQLMGDEKYADAVQALRKATELNPKAGGAYNMLGYAALQQGDTPGAVTAFTEYARIVPQEPNPHDSLGEALLAAGKFTEAEASFRKAAELSPDFWNAWDGVAYAKFFAGDKAGARAALVKARALAPRPGDKLAVDQLMAAMADAEGRTVDALQILSASEKLTDAPGVAFVPVIRATVLSRNGQHREALRLTSAALVLANSGELPAGASRNLRLQALRAQASAEEGIGDAAAAERSAAALTKEASAASDNAFAQSSMHYGLGILAMGKKDFPGARTHFEQCSRTDEFCRLQVVTAAERAGDPAAASVAKNDLLKLYLRDPLHLVVRATLSRTRPSTD